MNKVTPFLLVCFLISCSTKQSDQSIAADSTQRDSANNTLKVQDDATNRVSVADWPYDGSAPDNANPFILDLLKRLKEDYTSALDYNTGLYYIMWPSDMGFMQPFLRYDQSPEKVVHHMFGLGDGSFRSNNFDIFGMNIARVPLRFFTEKVNLCGDVDEDFTGDTVNGAVEEKKIEEGYYVYPLTDSVGFADGYFYRTQLSGEEPSPEIVESLKNLEAQIIDDYRHLLFTE